MRSGAVLVFRNTVANYLGTGVALLVALFLTPFIIRHLGKEAFGVWILVGALGAYGDLLDLGIDHALTKYVAEHASLADRQALERVVHTSLALYMVVGLVVVAFTVAAALAFPIVFRPPEHMVASSQILVLITGGSLALNFPLAMYTGVLRGLQRHDVINATAVLWSAGTAAFVVLTLSRGGGLVALGTVYAVGNTLNQLVRIVYLHIRYGDIRWIRWRPEKSEAGRILSFSTYAFIMRASSLVAYKTDEIVVGVFTSVLSVSVYGIGFRVSDLIRRFTGQFPTAIYPYGSGVAATQGREAVARLYLAGSRLSLAIAAPLAIFLGGQAPRFIDAWVGPGFEGSAPIARILSVAALVSVSTGIGVTLLRSMGMHQSVARWSMAEAAGNLALSLVLVRVMGITGVAVGTIVPTVLYTFGFVYPHIAGRLDLTARRLFDEILRPQLVPAAAAALLSLTLQRLGGTAGLGRLLGEAALTGGLYWAVFLWLGATDGDRRALRRLLGRTAPPEEASARVEGPPAEAP